jgi:hypothetical protein
MSENATIAESPVTKPKRFRHLKIAWAVFFAVLTVALCVLWVRSYWCVDNIGKSPNILFSNQGTVHFSWRDGEPWIDWTLWHYPIPARNLNSPFAVSKAPWQFQLRIFGLKNHTIWDPHWFLALGFAAIAPLSWLPFRFSLRTMLIVTTLVAVALALTVYLARN